MRVLTVCLGNICRSPTAAAALVEAADQEDVHIEVDSAGTGDWHIGELPDRRMRDAASDVGLELTGRARQVAPEDLATFDLVLAMDSDNLRVLESMVERAEPRGRIALFRTWDPAGTGDVPDPYYGGPEGFANVVTMCRRTASRIVQQVAEGSLP